MSRLHVSLTATNREQGYELQLNPQSGRTLEPRQQNGVRQSVRVWHAGSRDRKVESARLRWRVSYRLAGEVRQEMGEIPEFSIA